MEAELQKFVEFRKNNPTKWIFNLGHGFLPETPFEKAQFMTNWVKQAMAEK